MDNPAASDPMEQTQEQITLRVPEVETPPAIADEEVERTPVTAGDVEGDESEEK